MIQYAYIESNVVVFKEIAQTLVAYQVNIDCNNFSFLLVQLKKYLMSCLLYLQIPNHISSKSYFLFIAILYLKTYEKKYQLNFQLIKVLQAALHAHTEY